MMTKGHDDKDDVMLISADGMLDLKVLLDDDKTTTASKDPTTTLATTKDPTKQAGWTRHGPIFPKDAKVDGWPGKSGSIVSMASGPHYVIWSCASALRITPSVGRSMLRWDYNKTKVLFTVRKAPFWDTASSSPPCPRSRSRTATCCSSVRSQQRPHPDLAGPRV